MKSLKHYLCLLLYLSFVGCETERFETMVNISLDSRINNLKVLPCKVLIYRQFIEDNLLDGTQFIDTIYTDSFGLANKMISLSKQAKNEYYVAELLESKWQVPILNQDQKIIVAGIKNDIRFSIKPKWRRQIIIEDSSGKYELNSFQCYNSATVNFYQSQSFESFPKYGKELIYGSAPSYSHIFIKLFLKSRTTKETKIIEKTYDSELYYDIWIKF
jgi:hypothetical protein